MTAWLRGFQAGRRGERIAPRVEWSAEYIDEYTKGYAAGALDRAVAKHLADAMGRYPYGDGFE